MSVSINGAGSITGIDQGFNVTSGSVGIGTDNPGLTAHIFSTAATDVALIESTQNFATLRFKSATNTSGPTVGIDGGGGLQLDQKDTSKYIAFSIGSERLRITSAGNVGINDTNPTAKLSVVGNAYVSADSFMGENAGIFFSGWNDYGAGVYGRNSGNDLVMNAGSSEKLRIASDGDIEYKYDDADTDAEIGSTQLPHGLRIYNTNNTLGRLAGIHFSHGSAGTANAGIFHETTNTASNSTTCLGDLVFYTKNSGVSNMTEKLRIDSSGNLLLKTGEIDIQGGNKTVKTSAGFLQVGTSGSHYLSLITAGLQRLNITSDGNVNIKGGNLSVGNDSATLDFTDSNSNTKFVEVGANGGDALFVAHSSGYGVGYFGYEAGGDRLVIACDNGSGANKIDFIVNAGTATGGSTDNLNNVSPALRITSDGDVKIKSFGNASNASADALQIGKTDNNYGITILSATNAQGRIDFTDTEDTNDPQGKIAYYHDSNSLQFFTNGSAASNERLRINQNGCLQVGEPTGTPGEVMQIRKASGDVEVITYAAPGSKSIFNCTGSNRFALERGYNSVFEIQDPNGNGVRSDLRFDGNIILNKNMGDLNNSAVQLYRLIGPQNLSLGSGMTIVGGQTDTMSTKAARIMTSNNSGTAWFGPYGSIHPGSYTAMFHMKVSNNSNTSTFLRIDVSGLGITDAGGYGVHRPRSLNLAPSHFDNSDRYQYIGLDFNFVNPVGSNVIEVRGLNYNNGRGADLYLDHILIVPRIPSHDG